MKFPNISIFDIFLTTSPVADRGGGVIVGDRGGGKGQSALLKLKDILDPPLLTDTVTAELIDQEL